MEKHRSPDIPVARPLARRQKSIIDHPSVLAPDCQDGLGLVENIGAVGSDVEPGGLPSTETRLQGPQEFLFLLT